TPSASRVRRGMRLIAASASWGIAIGFRSDLAIFLAPLWLLAAARATILTAGISAVCVAALVGGWVFASASADGGLSRFLEAVRVQTQSVEDRYSIFGNVPISLYRHVYDLARF